MIASSFSIKYSFFHLSLFERRKVLLSLDREIILSQKSQKNLVFNFKNIQLLAYACELFAQGISFKDILIACSEIPNYKNDTLPDSAYESRIIYEEMYISDVVYDVPGFQKHHIDLLSKESRIGSSSFEIACSLWRLQRRIGQNEGVDTTYRSHMPVLYLSKNSLPTETFSSKLCHSSRIYEPLFILNRHAYPVSAAWVLLPKLYIFGYAREILSWIETFWPESLKIIQLQPFSLDVFFDPKNMMLCAEAFARGYVLHEAAEFLFERCCVEEEVLI